MSPCASTRIFAAPFVGGTNILGSPSASNPFFAKQKGFGVESETKMCLHIFVNERRSELARDVPVPPRVGTFPTWGSSGENPLLLHQNILLGTNPWAISSAG